MSITGITLKMCQEKLKMYLKAEEKVLLGQAYNIDGKEVTRADLGMIQRGIKLYEERCREYGDPDNVGMTIENLIPGRH
ncbi:hypothetical protein NRK67_03315 [Fusobacteria bacterium ZRK30]|nr:hypothetical protein NRK67_03315 [Fusobacteria bacterium ZRK30]